MYHAFNLINLILSNKKTNVLFFHLMAKGAHGMDCGYVLSNTLAKCMKPLSQAMRNTKEPYNGYQWLYRTYKKNKAESLTHSFQLNSFLLRISFFPRKSRHENT